MRPGYVRALALLHRTFSRYPLLDRLHILGRFLSAPLLRTLDAIPDGARVLEVGAGHGLWARLAAERADVVALEPDIRKMPRFRHPRLTAVVGTVDCIRGTFDAIAIVDVLYLMNAEARDALLRRCFERLRPGGVLLVKGIDPSRRAKRAWDRLQETIAYRVLHLSRGEGVFEHDARDEMIARMQRAGFANVQCRAIDRWYPHAHIACTAKRL